MTRNEKEAARQREKRKNPEYLAWDRQQNRDRARVRRLRAKMLNPKESGPENDRPWRVFKREKVTSEVKKMRVREKRLKQIVALRVIERLGIEI